MSLLFLTGADGGLASVIRAIYLDRGWMVAGFDRSQSQFTHDSYRSYPCDALRSDSVEAAMALASNELGTPRALIATVGGVRSWKLVQETAPEDFAALLDLNLNSTFYALHATLPLMQRAGIGSVITIGAAPALTHDATKGAYVAAKAAVIALTQVVANEGRDYGVNANCIVPTVIHTKANEAWGTPGEVQKWTSPESLAEMCFHLTSEAGHEVNGAVIPMPNGM